MTPLPVPPGTSRLVARRHPVLELIWSVVAGLLIVPVIFLTEMLVPIPPQYIVPGLIGGGLIAVGLSLWLLTKDLRSRFNDPSWIEVEPARPASLTLKRLGRTTRIPMAQIGQLDVLAVSELGRQTGCVLTFFDRAGQVVQRTNWPGDYIRVPKTAENLAAWFSLRLQPHGVLVRTTREVTLRRKRVHDWFPAFAAARLWNAPVEAVPALAALFEVESKSLRPILDLRRDKDPDALIRYEPNQVHAVAEKVRAYIAERGAGRPDVTR